jgi:hypothetical protein
MVTSFTKTRDALAESQNQVDVTMTAMYHVREARGESVSNAYKNYKEAVEQLKQEAEDAKFRAQSMKEESDDHIHAWQKEMETIKDPTIKASLQSRRDAVKSNYALVRMYADDVRKAYEPFVQTNQEMVKALSIDLSPATIDTLAPAMDKVAGAGKTVREKIVMMQIAMNNIANGLSPLGEMK